MDIALLKGQKCAAVSPPKGDEAKKEGIMAHHTVSISVTGAGTLKCVPLHVKVRQRDTITWKISRNYPFGIMVKSPITPLERHFYLSSLRPSARKIIDAKMLNFAPPGHYPYGIGAFNGQRILVEDPEIIVKPPVRGG